MDNTELLRQHASTKTGFKNNDAIMGEIINQLHASIIFFNMIVEYNQATMRRQGKSRKTSMARLKMENKYGDSKISVYTETEEKRQE